VVHEWCIVNTVVSVRELAAISLKMSYLVAVIKTIQK
jgi:hypothetical protein